jgi:hypothetical protein
MKKVNLTFKTIRSHVVLQPDWKKILEGQYTPPICSWMRTQRAYG